MEFDINELNPLHLEDIKNEKHPSIFFSQENYKVLIYRLIDDSEDLKVTSTPFIIAKDTVYDFDKENNKLIKNNDIENFYKTLDTLVDKTMRKVDLYVEDIDDMEEDIYDDKVNISTIFQLKKELVRVERVLNQTVRVHNNFLFDYIKPKNDNNLYIKLEDIDEHLNRTLRTVNMSILKLDNIYSLHSSISNEKINKTMYNLTIISSIFLPLNLIVGFFGMNTQGMFLSAENDGTAFVFYILSTLLILQSFLFFRRNKFKIKKEW